MTRLNIFAATAVVAFVFFAASSSARPALKDVAEIREGIIAVGIAYEISEECETLRPRILRGLNYLNRLKGFARDLGYSDDEIDAYVDSKSEQRRLEAMARARLADMGAKVGVPSSYCSVGRTEISKGSPIGQLLR